MNANPIETLVDAYLAAYCEPDRATRERAVARLWADGGRLVDPPLQASGHAAIVAQSDALLAQFPGHRFRRTTQIDSHHDFARYGWALADAAGRTVLEGCDVAELSADGRLQRVVGFFGPPVKIAA
jgi:hypothetical protein